jgi:hypothetical protein
MEVDRVWAGEDRAEDGGYWQEDGGNNESEEKVEVDFVGEMCMRCGGHGHYARECPTPKGKGKGKGGSKGKGKGKGNQYEYGKGKGKGGGKSGGGKGFGGECWTCGQKGHRSNDCPNKGKTGAEISEVEVGGVWTIA